MRLPSCIKISLTALTFTTAMNYAAAENIGVIAVNGVEKVKVSRCSSTSNSYLYSFIVHNDGTWDYYDYDMDLLLPTIGVYVGTPESRKINLAAGPFFTNIFVSVVGDVAESLCGTSLNLVSNTPLVYKVKINKKRTTASVKTKLNVRGYSPAYGRYGTAKYTYSGKGSYSIESL